MVEMRKLYREVGNSAFLRSVPPGWVDGNVPSKEESLWVMISTPKIINIREILDEYVYWVAHK